MSKFVVATLMIATALALSAPAQDRAAPGGTNDVAAAAEAPVVESLRDPFWPIGWKPEPVQPGVAAAPRSPIRWEEATRQLEVTALSQAPDGTYYAIIKGLGLVEVGDIIAVAYNNLIYRWRIKGITDQGIVPERLGVTNQRGGSIEP